MKRWLTKPQRRDIQFAAFILATLICVGGFLSSGTETTSEQNGGWRRIDIEALTKRINAGDLVNHEAAWYRRHENPGGK
ncbi:MAG: hypothetical protein ABFS56_10765 [Pseudomonadota bacterium]